MSSDGSATYQIPLAVPPGRGGIHPELTLTYDSRQGDGVLGIGWGLTVFPRITRCYQTERADTPEARVHALDGYCLDGRELVETDASDDGTVYRTRPDAHVEVVALSDEDGPHWRLRDQEGLIYFFGATPNSRLSPYSDTNFDKSIAWDVNRVEDRYGNAMEVLYDHSYIGSGGTALEHRLRRIEYTWHDGQDPLRSVTFHYVNRAVPFDGYARGLHLRQTGVVDRIVMRSPDGSTLREAGDATANIRDVRAYRFAYLQDGTGSSARVNLTSLRDCAIDSGGVEVCKPPQRFDWTRPGTDFANLSEYGIEPFEPAEPLRFEWPADRENGEAIFFTQTGDIDGDGREEIVFRISIPEDDGYAEEGRSYVAFINADGVDILETTDFGGPTESAAHLGDRRWIMDINLDGADDFVFIPWDGPLEYRTWDGSDWSASVSTGVEWPDDIPVNVHWQETNGDGYPDLIYCAPGPDEVFYWHVRLTNALGATHPGFDAPEQTPFTCPEPGLIEVRNCGPSYRDQCFTSHPLPQPDKPWYPIVADFDGDGVPDWLQLFNDSRGDHPGPGVYKRVPTTGVYWGHYLPLSNLPFDPNDVATVHIIDFNGDSLRDILLLRHTVRQDETYPYDYGDVPIHWYEGTPELFVNTGDEIVPHLTGSLGPPGYPLQHHHFQAGFVRDVNRDGLQDFVVPVADPTSPPVVEGDPHHVRWMVALSDGHSLPFRAPLTIPHAGLMADLSHPGTQLPSAVIPPIHIDMDGSGALSTIFWDGEQNNETLFYRELSFAPDLMYAVRDTVSTGDTVHERVFEYGPLNDSESYAPTASGTTCTSELTCPPRASSLVTATYVRTRRSAEGGGLTELDEEAHTRVEYRYSGGRYHRFGRGWLGFESVETWQPAVGVHTVSTYDPAGMRVGKRFPLRGFTLDTTTRYYTRTTASGPVEASLEGSVSTSVSPRVHELEGVEPSFFVFPVEIIASSFADGELVSQTTTTNAEVDDFGNTLANIVTDGERVDTRTVEYEETGGPLFLNHLPRTITVESCNNGCSYYTIENEYQPVMDTGLELVRRTTVPDGDDTRSQIVEYSYDVYGNVESVNLTDGVNERPTTVSYLDFESMFPTVITYPNAVEEEISIHPVFGVPWVHIDGNGARWETTLDGFGRVLHEQRSGGGAVDTEWTEGAVHPEVRITTASGSEELAGFDALGRVIYQRARRALDGQWVEQQTQYDAVTGLTSARSLPAPVDAPSHWVRWAYLDDAPVDPGHTAVIGLPRIRVVRDGAGAETTHSHMGRHHEWTDPDGNEYSEITNGLGGILSRVEPEVGGLLGTTIYTYGPFGRLTAVRDAADNSTEFTYDSLGNLVRWEDPDRGVRTYEYDGFGDLWREVHEGDALITIHTYDDMGRPVERRDTRGTDEQISTWTWDDGPNAAMKLVDTHNSEGDVSVHYDYDSVGRALRETVTVGGRDPLETFVRARDTAGRPTRIMLPNGRDDAPVEIVQAFDGYGNLESVGFGVKCNEVVDGTTGGTYFDCEHEFEAWRLTEVDAAGRATRTEAGNGVSNRIQYETATGRVSRFESLDGLERLQDFSMRYHPSGDVRARSTFAWDTGAYRTEELEYDDRHRLRWARMRNGDVDAAPGAWLAEFEARYDAADNVTFRTDVGAFQYDGTGRPHAVIAAGTEHPEGSLDYDARGNQILSGEQVRRFDLRDRLQEVDAPGFGDLRLGYTADGAEAISLHSGSDGDLEILRLGDAYERRAAELGGVQHVYRAFVGREAVAQLTWDDQGVSPPEIAYFHGDVTGSTTLITNAGADVVERRAYDAFGSPRDPDWLDAFTSLPAPSFPGYDGTVTGPQAELGLVRMGARHYDPSLSQMLSPDPVVVPGIAADLNPYSFAWNNPLGYFDPSGMQEQPRGGLGVTAVVDSGDVHWPQPPVIAANVTINGVEYYVTGSIIGPTVPASNEERPSRLRRALSQAAGNVGGRVVRDARDAWAANLAVWTDVPPIGLFNLAFDRPQAPSSLSGMALHLSGAGEALGVDDDSPGATAGKVHGHIGIIVVSLLIPTAAGASLAGGAAGAGAAAVEIAEGAGSAATSSGARTLFHYTTKQGLPKILETMRLLASRGPRNARFGDGVYLTDIAPEMVGGMSKATTPAGKMSLGQLSARLMRMPYFRDRFVRYIEVDVTGLALREAGRNAWVFETEVGLDLAGRIVRYGTTLK